MTERTKARMSFILASHKRISTPAERLSAFPRITRNDFATILNQSSAHAGIGGSGGLQDPILVLESEAERLRNETSPRTRVLTCYRANGWAVFQRKPDVVPIGAMRLAASLSGPGLLPIAARVYGELRGAGREGKGDKGTWMGCSARDDNGDRIKKGFSCDNRI